MSAVVNQVALACHSINRVNSCVPLQRNDASDEELSLNREEAISVSDWVLPFGSGG
jgi:hypothetical protein